MMKRLIAIILCLLSLFGCRSKMVDDLVNLHRDLSDSEVLDSLSMQRVEALNESLEILQTLCAVLSDGHFVSSITPVEEGGRTGYHILFTNGESMTVYEGKDGKDARTPKIGVAKDEDGKYYWTLDGEWLLDSDSQKVEISSGPDEGETVSADDGTVPRIEIRSGFWYVSFDLGKTWQLLGRATGEDGLDGEDGVDYIVKLDWTSDEGVGFVLADGTSFFVQYAQKAEVELSLEDNMAMISSEETIEVGYTLSEAASGMSLVVESDGYYVSVVNELTDTTGFIDITCPREYREGHVNVLVHSLTGIVDVKVISMQEKKFYIEGGDEIKLSHYGGNRSLRVFSNTDYSVEPDSSLSEWMEVSKSGDGNVILLRYSANDGPARAGILSLFTANSVTAAKRILITQDSEYASIDKGSFVFSSQGGTEIAKVTSRYEVTAEVDSEDSEWLSAIVNVEEEVNTYSVIVSATVNGNLDERVGEVKVTSSDGVLDVATISVVQKGRKAELSDAMILVGRPNYSNDFTVALPIVFTDFFDFYVDWGDGNGTHYVYSEDYDELTCPMHRYEEVTPGQTFEIAVTGAAPYLSSDIVPSYYKNSVKNILQWGDLGITDMNCAFKGYIALESLPADEKGAFRDVEDFSMAFYGCTSLRSVAKGLFEYAQNAKNFSYCFSNCQSLVSIPEGLFSNCPEVTAMQRVFENCKSLQTLPSRLFAGCSKVEDFGGMFYDSFRLRNIASDILEGCTGARGFILFFYGCSSLESVPEHLFDDCTDMEDIGQCFNGCRSLSDVPVSIFDKNVRITDCYAAFVDNNANHGESPYTVIDGQKVHLYERKDYPELFAMPYNFSRCFGECHNMTDYESMPGEWR